MLLLQSQRSTENVTAHWQHHWSRNNTLPGQHTCTLSYTQAWAQSHVYDFKIRHAVDIVAPMRVSSVQQSLRVIRTRLTRAFIDWQNVERTSSRREGSTMNRVFLIFAVLTSAGIICPDLLVPSTAIISFLINLNSCWDCTSKRNIWEFIRPN